MKSLKLALIHLDIRHQKVEANRKALLDLIRQGAEQGAHLILAPEMAVSGYSFDNREAITPFVEEIHGPTLTAVRELAWIHGFYACFGLALVESESGIYTNSVVAVDPNGDVVCRYNKINAESRWACPGDPKQDNTFETPWGRVGLLICSDTYYGLMPRITALRGADLLIVPANWPPASLNPVELWQARTMENGFYLAACNRTGVEQSMDYRRASTCVCTPWGEMLLNERSNGSQLFWVDLPLTSQGRLYQDARRQCLDGRRRQYYHDCYLNLRNIRDLTSFLNLPQPGLLNLHCIVPDENEHPIDTLMRSIAHNTAAAAALYLLPSYVYSDTALDWIARIARNNAIGVLTRAPAGAVQHLYTFHNNGESCHWHLPRWPFDGCAQIPRIDFGPARLHIVPFDALAHPEMAVASAKQGCDLLLASEDRLSPEHRLLAGVRTIDNICLAVCALNDAGIWITPEGHNRWEELSAGPGEVCQYSLDTHYTREKKYQDRVDFEVLLRSGFKNSP